MNHKNSSLYRFFFSYLSEIMNFLCSVLRLWHGEDLRHGADPGRGADWGGRHQHCHPLRLTQPEGQDFHLSLQLHDHQVQIGRGERKIVCTSEQWDPDPDSNLGLDPTDPHVFGHPGSGSFYQQAKIVRKTLASWRSMTKWAGSGSTPKSNVMDPEHCSGEKSWGGLRNWEIQNSGKRVLGVGEGGARDWGAWLGKSVSRKSPMTRKFRKLELFIGGKSLWGWEGEWGILSRGKSRGLSNSYGCLGKPTGQW